MKFVLGITFAFASVIRATPIPISGTASVGSPGLQDLCVSEQACDAANGGIRFSDNGPGPEFYSTPPPVGNYFDLSHDLMVQYDCCFYDLFVSNGSMIAAHLGFPNSYPPTRHGHGSHPMDC